MKWKREVQKRMLTILGVSLFNVCGLVFCLSQQNTQRKCLRGAFVFLVLFFSFFLHNKCNMIYCSWLFCLVKRFALFATVSCALFKRSAVRVCWTDESTVVMWLSLSFSWAKVNISIWLKCFKWFHIIFSRNCLHRIQKSTHCCDDRSEKKIETDLSGTRRNSNDHRCWCVCVCHKWFSH